MKASLLIRFSLTVVIISAVLWPVSSIVLAQSLASGKSFGTDQPLEITADALEVQQATQLAIFQGRVLVVQGEMRLKSDKLVVYYSNSENKTSDDTPSIRKIDATGNVFLSSPRETAKGQRGIYDIENKMITLTGDVTLTQGQSILKGQNMTLNLETGLSRIEGGVSSGDTGGRVRGLFVPQKKKN